VSTKGVWPYVLYALCAGGLSVALVLTIGEARAGDPLRVSGVMHREAGGVVTVEADVHNRTDVPRCPDMRAAVRDRESRDLAEVRATPVDGDGSIPPGASVRFGARIDDLTRRELDEALSDVVIYVYEPHRCPG
jgi:hypothetical protein